MNATRVVAGILAAAALIFAFLWWRAPAGDPAAPDAATGTLQGEGRQTGPAPVTADAVPPRTDAVQSDAGVPLGAMVRSEIAVEFRGLRLPDGVAEALAAGNVEEALRALESATDGDSTVALAKLSGFCAGSIGSSTLDVSDVRRHATGDLQPGTVAMLERTLQQQREWGKRVVRGCEQAGLLRTGPPATQARAAERSATLAERLRRCADAGHAGCLAVLAQRDGADPRRRLAMLQSAAVLGSPEAQAVLLMELERNGRTSTAQARQAARYWRESLATSDPEYRAALLGCYDEACDPRSLDRAVVHAQLESAVRDGSVTALSHLMTSERTAAEDVAIAGAAIDATQVPRYMGIVNPSETDAYAWKVVAEKLALQGCLGLWPTWAPFVGGTAAAERELRPSQIDEARRLAEAHWQSHGRSFAAKRGCTPR